MKNKAFPSPFSQILSVLTRRILFFFFAFFLGLPSTGPLFSQEKIPSVFKRFFDEALTNDTAYENLRYLCGNFPGRLCGTPEAADAVEYTKQIMEGMGLDRVYLQKIMVRNWQRGDPEQAFIISSSEKKERVAVVSLGLSVGTGAAGITAGVVEVKSFEELRALGESGVKGKIVFFNQALDPTLIDTFRAYGGAAFQRSQGASEAAQYGAAGVVVRSLTLALDDYPHTGSMYYRDGVNQIPAVAVSTMGAETLSRALKTDKGTKLFFRSTCLTLPDVESHNVIGEIRGSEFPNEIITVGGHIDAWFNTEGAHDDGGGCMQSIEVLRLFKSLGIRPRRTLRAVMFMDEEVAQRGGRTYAEEAEKAAEIHIAALESDRGVLVPRAVGITAPPEKFALLRRYERHFHPYGMGITQGGGGTDIWPLREKSSSITLMSLIPDSQRYFDFHHSAFDTFEQVNKREMQMGSAAMACILYLIDRVY